MKFIEFKKIPRLSRETLILEKIDGTNGQIYIASLETLKNDSDLAQAIEFIEQFCLYVHPDNPHVEEKDKLYLFAGSRNRWLKLGKESDNYGFASWVTEHAVELIVGLGKGRHYGEWYGKGIQVGYGLDHKRFALFNTSKWVKKTDNYIPPLEEKQQYCPDCCEVVPILFKGEFDTAVIDASVAGLKNNGSRAVPGYMKPEGIVVYHTAAGQYFKKTIENDEQPKSKIKESSA